MIWHHLSSRLNFFRSGSGLSEKHAKFEKIFLMVLTNQLIYLVNFRTMRKIFSNHVCFTESTNFIYIKGFIFSLYKTFIIDIIKHLEIESDPNICKDTPHCAVFSTGLVKDLVIMSRISSSRRQKILHCHIASQSLFRIPTSLSIISWCKIVVLNRWC